MPRQPEYYAEVADALEAIGNPSLGARIAEDRGSRLQYFGIRTPALRAVVKRGFSFYDLSDRRVLEVWGRLWRYTPNGDVMFAALEYYRPRVRRSADRELWPVMRAWSERIDNWAHCDLLSGVYSWLLASRSDEVYPQLELWNAQEESEWLRRISIVSLIHYSGKHAVFMPLDQVLPLVSTCPADHRHYIERAVGWVLRETGHTYPHEGLHRGARRGALPPGVHARDRTARCCAGARRATAVPPDATGVTGVVARNAGCPAR